MLTGAQTVKRRKAGSRVTRAGTFAGSGQALTAGDEDEKRTGTGFPKRAGRYVNLLANSTSLLMSHDLASAPAKNGPWLRKDACSLCRTKVKWSSLCGIASLLSPCHAASVMPSQDPEEDDSGVDVQELQETDKDRRQTMMTSMDASEANQLRTGTLSDFWGDFILPNHSTPESYGTGDNKNTWDHASTRGGILPKAGNTSTSTCTPPTPVGRGERPEPLRSRPGKLAPEALRRESLCHTVTKPLTTTDSTLSNFRKVGNLGRTRENENQGNSQWSCLACTL
jgi:hypothetical protein